MVPSVTRSFEEPGAALVAAEAWAGAPSGEGGAQAPSVSRAARPASAAGTGPIRPGMRERMVSQAPAMTAKRKTDSHPMRGNCSRAAEGAGDPRRAALLAARETYEAAETMVRILPYRGRPERTPSGQTKRFARFAGGGWKHVYKLNSAEEYFQKHNETGQLVMLLQEEIVFEEYYRCYCIGGKYVRIMSYEPRNPHHLRYVSDFKPSAERYQLMEDIVLRINKYLGYDFNTVELALRDGVPYAIDFCNPAPDADKASVGEENFEWVVETAASYAIERAQQCKKGTDNLTWGEYIKTSVNKMPLI